jgi:iron complex outermembrane recepter protein
LWNINDRAELRVIADYADADEQCCDAIFRVDTPFRDTAPSGLNPFEAAGLPADGGAPNVGRSAFNNRRSNAGQFENPFEQWGISAELNWDLGEVDLTYIGSFRYFDAASVQFSDFVGTDVFSVRPEAAGGLDSFDEIETTTHELRLAGDTGRLQWMVGGFFMWEDIVEEQGLGLGSDFSANTSANLSGLFPDPVLLPVVLGDLVDVAIPGSRSPLQFDGSFLATQDPARAFTGGVDPVNSYAQNRFNQTTKSWSLFTHNTLRLTDQFDFVFGLRWVDEDKDGEFEQRAVNNPNACLNAQDNAAAFAGTGAAGLAAITAGFTCFPFVTPANTGIPGLPTEFDNNFSDEELIWTLRGIYRFTDDVMGYVSFTHGFKAGGFNLDATAAALGADGPADPSFDSETIDAWEVGLKTDLFDRRARLNTTLFYQDIDDFQVLEFTGVQFTTFNVPKAESKGVEVELQVTPIRQLDVNLGVTYLDAEYPSDCDGGVFNQTVSALCGNRLTNASDWVGIAGLTWEDNLPGTELTYFLHTNVRAESKRRTSTQFVDPASGNPREIPFQGSNTKLNLRLGLGPADGRWAFELWGNNLTDKQTTNNTFNVPLRGVGSLDTPARASFIEAPRTLGATIRANL